MTATTERPFAPAVSWRRQEAMALAETAYRRLADLLGDLEAADWDRPTDCEGWTVRDLAGHLVGAMRSAASVREQAGQQWEAQRRTKAEGGYLVDHLTAIQIERTADLEPGGLAAEAERLVGPATAGRRGTPAALRRTVSIPVRMAGIDEQWPLAYFVDVILTRDAWLHRIDLCRAVDRPPELTADHDGHIVADVADEWGRRHGQAFTLTLTGAAGGRFAAGGTGDGVVAIELEAVEFCRTISGRSTGTGLLTTEVPF